MVLFWRSWISCWVISLILVRSAKGHGDHYVDTFDIVKGPLSCTSLVHKFDPNLHKTTYRVGVYNSEGEEVVFDMYGTLFADYLTETAGKRIDPPVSFEVVPVTLKALMTLAETEQVDFMFASSAVFSCMTTTYGAEPLGTIINRRESRGQDYNLDMYGGVMFVMKDNDEVNNIEDFKDRIIGAGSITAMGGGQTQFYEMVRHGLSYVADPKQVIFTKDERLVVQGLLDGDFEIGFARTDQIERHTTEDGEPLRDDTFKIINPQTHVLHDGNLFPFVSSTGLHPEWPVAAFPHVDPTLALEVQSALLAIRDHASSIELNQSLRCDTTSRLAELAVEARTNGLFAGFRSARSYSSVRTKQEVAGFLRRGGLSDDLHCIRGDTLYEDIECPTGYYKVTMEEFDMSCELAGLECKEEHECYCQPCVKAFEVDVYQLQVSDPSMLADLTTSNVTRVTEGCEKMSVCGVVQQTKTIVLHVVDNLERENPTVKVIMHLSDRDVFPEAKPLGAHTYEILWSNKMVEIAIMEVFFDDEQIPESPLRIQVVERNCNVDYEGLSKIPSKNGECECGDATVEIDGKCVDVAIFAIVGAVVGVLLILFGTLVFMRYKNLKSDEIWSVHVEELHLDDPVEVIGQGSFGVVLLAEYRGTKVAIKRVLKGKKKRGTKGSDNNSKRAFAKFLSSRLTSGALPSSSIVSMDLDSDNNPAQDSSQGDSSQDKQEQQNSAVSEFDSGSNLSRHFSLGFLTREINSTKSKWAMVFPWLPNRQERSSISVHDSILGTEGGSGATRSGMVYFLFPWLNEHSRRKEEFKTEMRVLARLRHPCITTVMGAVITPHRDPVMVMEYMEYGSLYDLLRNKTVFLGGELILQICRDLAQGLRFLHSSRPPILHGDMKARNILIDGRFRAKLCDFGLSTKRTKNISGTPYWLAPEYLMGVKQYNTMCDVYSVGIVIWEIYSRTAPYEGEHYKAVIRDVCNRRINKRPKVPEDMPPKFVELMKKCWSPDAHYRPQARNLDVILLEMSTEDAEPITEDERANKKRAGDLLYDIFPKHVADALKEGKKVEPEKHETVTVIFSDIVSFTDISRQIGPEKVCDMLDRLYHKFDACARKHDVFKVETIGDAWMGVTNLEGDQEHTHVRRIAEYAVDMVNEANTVLIDTTSPSRGYVNIRVGFHSGSVVSNVIGSLNKRYCLFGDTVNTASRMESNSAGNRILTSHHSYKLLKEQAPEMLTKCRGKIDIKGKGEMLVHWVGDDRIHSRKHMLRRSVEFVIDSNYDNNSVRSLFASEDDTTVEQEDQVDEKRKEHAKEAEFMSGLENVITEIDKEVKEGNGKFISSDVVVNYQELLSKQ